MSLFEDFFHFDTFQRSLHSTFLVLIPKKGGAEELKDFRPISLIGGLYKLLVKGLENRLKANVPGLLLKLDVEKVFDHVNWDYLFVVMSNMRVGKLPTSYLGLPLGASFKTSRVWDAVEEGFRKRLSLWKRQYLSKGGRLTLIKSTLSNLPIYFPSLFVIPLKGSEESGCWNPPFSRHFNDWELKEVEGLFQNLNPLMVRREVEDVLSFKESKDGIFSVRSLYNSFTRAFSDPFPWGLIRRSWAPMRWVLHSSIKMNLLGWHGAFVGKRRERFTL
ncbi:hypothetical protein CK203_012542 [Vitis vinifera]|uniref:Reverse transcriptase domain-containing protein n=1 Tax=Vitis vinifera TaxID=29760 RepID=A0A438KN39_VITVI|nr:hypothetical protein CK203_012542 [Vitis vinifera]